MIRPRGRRSTDRRVPATVWGGTFHEGPSVCRCRPRREAADWEQGMSEKIEPDICVIGAGASGGTTGTGTVFKLDTKGR